MIRSKLVEKIVEKNPDMKINEIDKAVKAILEYMCNSLSHGERIELRGFGSFSLHYRPPRKAYNPKTSEVLHIGSKYVPHFKPGKELRARINYDG